MRKNIKPDIKLLKDYWEERDPRDPPTINPEEDMLEPIVVKRVTPNYPQEALDAKVEGSVVVKAWIDKTGKTKKVVVVKSDNEILNNAAIEAMKQWVFSPAKILGMPVSVWVSLPMHFNLNRK